MFKSLIKLSFIKTCKKAIFYVNKELHTTPRYLAEEIQAVDNKLTVKINETLAKYSAEQKEKILQIINNYNLSELLGYEISKGRAKKLLGWRHRYGLFNNLVDIFTIEGFGIKVSDKFFQSLLLEPKTSNLELAKGQTRISGFITPSLEADQRQAIQSCASVHIGVNSITWSHLCVPGRDVNAPCLLTHWQHQEISEKRLHLNELIQRCLYIQNLIPTADCYVFETPEMVQAKSNPGSVEQQNVNIQKAQVTAIMGYALASRKYIIDNERDKKLKSIPDLLYVRRFLTARLFNHLVGSERVCAEETILSMMRTFYNANDAQDFLPSQQDPESDYVQQPNNNNNDVNVSGRVQFPVELRQMFSKAPRYCREFLGQSLLLNLAFVRLVLLQDSESIAAVSRNKI